MVFALLCSFLFHQHLLVANNVNTLRQLLDALTCKVVNCILLHLLSLDAVNKSRFRIVNHDRPLGRCSFCIRDGEIFGKASFSSMLIFS